LPSTASQCGRYAGRLDKWDSDDGYGAEGTFAHKATHTQLTLNSYHHSTTHA